MAPSSTPWLRQNAASSAMPSRVLAKVAAAPSCPMQATTDALAISTPQMVLVTVTCLVCAIDVWRLSGGAGRGQRPRGGASVNNHHRRTGSRPPAGEPMTRLPHHYNLNETEADLKKKELHHLFCVVPLRRHTSGGGQIRCGGGNM